MIIRGGKMGGSNWLDNRSKRAFSDSDFLQIMVTQQRRDLLMNIPALKKLDAMLIVIISYINLISEVETIVVSNEVMT